MKLKELFDKYTFDEILPYLKVIDPEKPDAMPNFREAFDLLRHIEPSKEDCGKVSLEWSDFEPEEEKYVEVVHLAGDKWEDALAKEVVVADDLHLCEEEMAAHCLWEITFWGFENVFDPEDRNPFEYPPEQMNKYDVALYKLQLSHWKHTTPKRYRSKDYPLYTNADYCLKKVRSNKNRSKRKRNYRVECRKKYLKMHSQREEMIKKLVRCGAFKRVDEDTNKHIEGTGLGLSIVKQLVDLMGGKVTVNSVYTKGSTFIIEIPQVCENKSKMGQYNFEKSGSISHKENYVPKFEAPEARILVVDDNEANLMVVSKLLRETKVRVDTALSGAEALKKTLNIHYDAIFMDHLMPEMDGIECRRRIIDQTGGRCRETSIVILTANADEENRALYQKENFDGYLVKPVSGAELENELYRILPRDIVHITGNRTEIAEESISWMNNSKKRKRVVITTESVADLPQELIDRYDIAVLPHKVKTAEGIFKDGNEIDTKGVLKYMEDPDRSVTTMVPDVKEIEEFFAKQLSVANNIIHISISSKVQHSGYAVALEASKSFDSVFVIDTGHLSSGQGLLAVEACRMAEDGKSPDEIIARIERLKKKVHTSFIVDNLDFLARARQVGKGIANLVNSLMGRPVLVLKKGTMGLGKLYFGSRKSAWKKYINKCLGSERPIDTKMLFVTYVGLSKRDLDWIREQIGKRVKFDEVYFQQASPAIAVNCGPGTFGLLLREKDKEDNK